jgi:hypothetical protein
MRWAAMACGFTENKSPLNLVAGFLGFKDLLLDKDFQIFQLKAAEEALNRFLCLVCTGL